MVAVEVVFLLPVAIRVELSPANLVEVDEGHALLGGHHSRPTRLRLAHDLARRGVVVVARGEAHQDGVRSRLATLGDVTAQVSAVGVDHLVLTGLLDGHRERVVGCSRYHGTCASRVEGAVVVVADGDDDPVAGSQRLAHIGPQLAVECAGRHATERLVLHRYLVSVEILTGVVAPSPLSVGSVALGAVAHGGVAHEEEHGVGALACGAWCGSRHERLGYRVGGVVNHLVHILDGVGQVVERLSHGHGCGQGQHCHCCQ